MKTRGTLLLTLFFLSSFSITSFAQDQKLGHINTIDILLAMPDWKMAEQNLETYAQQIRKKLTDEEVILQEEYLKYREEVNSGLLSPAYVQEKEKEFEQRGNELQQKRLDARNSLAEKEKELFNPIKENLNKVIQEFMQEENYAYLFDTAQGNVAIGPMGEDVTAKIKIKLGL